MCATHESNIRLLTYVITIYPKHVFRSRTPQQWPVAIPASASRLDISTFEMVIHFQAGSSAATIYICHRLHYELPAGSNMLSGLNPALMTHSKYWSEFRRSAA